MVETPRRIAGPGLLIVERPGLACVNLRGDARDAKFVRAVASVADLEPPQVPNTVASGLLASLIWLGPDEWLMTSETQHGDELARRLLQAFAGLRAAATEVGDGRIVYALSGVHARSVLARGCSIDLHPRVFRTGQCAQTLLAKAAVLIHQRAPEPLYDLHVARSFAGYAWEWLANAAREYA